jgi:hypothetical protein
MEANTVAKGITLKSVLRTLARLRDVARVPAQDMAEALLPHLKAQHLIEVATYLERVGGRMLAQQANKKCAVCGSPLGIEAVDGRELKLNFIRADACYCSAKCKQKAYRKRVTATRSLHAMNASRVTAVADTQNSPNVTQGTAEPKSTRHGGKVKRAERVY